MYHWHVSSEFAGHRTSQLIALEVKDRQLGKLPNLGRNGACQRILSLQNHDERFTKISELRYCNRRASWHLPTRSLGRS